MITHTLKIEDNYLKRLLNGKKKSEIRFNDRDYQLGDVLEFPDYEYSEPCDMNYVHFRITHIHSGFGLAENYVCLSLVRVESLQKEDMTHELR